MPSGLRTFHRLKKSRFSTFLQHKPLDEIAARPLPRTIWIFWAQGEENAPDLVKYCIGTWRKLNPTWDLTVLDKTAADELVEMNDLSQDLSWQIYSDILRTRLLEAKGGVWVDSTLLCATSLDNWIDLVSASGFFVFQRPHPDRILSNWFIAAQPGHPLLKMILRAYVPYVKENIGKRPYFAYHQTVEYLYRSDREFRRHFDKIPRLDAVSMHRLQRWLVRPEHERGPAPNLIGLPLHKLTWKKDICLKDLIEVTSETLNQ